MNTQEKPVAVAYFRTSSAANVGVDKDSLTRQQQAVQAYAKRHRLPIVREFYDPAVSGADPVADRPGFAALLEYIASNGARTVLVENASRFARDLAVQLTGHDLLKSLGIALIPVDAPDHFIEETPTAVMVRQILGAVAQFEKATLVLKLRRARERKRAASGKCEGRKSVAQRAPEAVRRAHELRRIGLRRTRSFREIATQLAAEGFTSASGKPYSPSVISSMLEVADVGPRATR